MRLGDHYQYVKTNGLGVGSPEILLDNTQECEQALVKSDNNLMEAPCRLVSVQ